MDIEKIYCLMSRMRNEEKMGLPGLNPKRADVITAGMAILISVLHKSGAAGITVSSNGVIEGFVEDYVQKYVAC
jgi:exopolyphosphatase/guanosine-5'-triphosphate,3'-diphosphate pyrophosphatase